MTEHDTHTMPKWENNLTIGMYGPDVVNAERYHSDQLCSAPSLSRGVAHTMISECPLKGWLSHPRLNPQYAADDPSASMDFGSVGHELILGSGGGIDIGDFDDFKTNAAKDWRKESRAANRTPVLRKTYYQAVQLREGALREFKRLGVLEDFEACKYEQTIIFRSRDSYLRARPDATLIDKGSGTISLFDVKITANAEPEACTRRIGELGYPLQAQFYSEAAASIEPDLRGRTAFIFLFVEKEWPFLVSPITLNGEWMTIARSQYDRAVNLWAKCMSENKWGGYSQGIVEACPRPWDMQSEIGASI